MRSFRKNKRGVSNVIVFVLGLVIVTVVVANVFLWNFEMNQLDWEKTQEDFFIVNVTPYLEDWSYNPSQFALGGLTTNVSGDVSDLASDDNVYMTFRSYDSGTDASDLADQRSDIYSPSAKGMHSNFTAQQRGPDLTYDTLIEEDIGTGSINYEHSAESYSETGQSSHNFNYSLQKGSGNDRLVVVTVSWEDAQASASISNLTFDEMSMTRIANVTVSTNNSEYVSLWYLLDSNLPNSSGSYNLAVTTTETITREIYMAVAEYSGVEQTTPDDYDIHANASPGNISIALTASADGSLVVTGVGEGGTNNFTDTKNITTIQEQMLTSSGSALGHNINVNSGNITIGWNNLAAREGMAGAVWQPATWVSNYELDLEVQWTNASYTLEHEELCIKTGTFGGLEDLQVRVRSGGSWIWVMNLTSSQWNNISVSSYLTGSTLTIQFLGGTETNDTTQDNWDIDITLLHVWSDQNKAEIEFIGPSNTQDWTHINWTIDSAWTIGSVNVTLQLYNYTLGDYPSDGNGYISYTSSATPNTDEGKTQTITANPTHFRNATGHWKMKAKGVKATNIQFDFKTNLIQSKPMKAAGTLFTFKNTGSLTCHLVSLWIINSTVHIHYDIDVLINSGDTSSYVRNDIDLPKGQFTVKVVTERGNIKIHS